MSRKEGKETERARAQEVSLGYARKEETAREEGGRVGHQLARSMIEREVRAVQGYATRSLVISLSPSNIIRVFKAN